MCGVPCSLLSRAVLGYSIFFPFSCRAKTRTVCLEVTHCLVLQLIALASQDLNCLQVIFETEDKGLLKSLEHS